MDGLDRLCLFGDEAALTMATFLNLSYKVNLKKINYLIEKTYVYHYFHWLVLIEYNITLWKYQSQLILPSVDLFSSLSNVTNIA